MKKCAKIIIDIAMTVMLPLVMAQLITGTKFHEWLGSVMICTFILHHILDWKWFACLFKGKYNPARVLRTVTDILMLADIILLAVSGIARSFYVFKEIPKFMSIVTAGKMHISAGWWGFILMSLHLGIHVKLMASFIMKRKPQKKIVRIICIIPALAVVGIGINVFGRLQIKDYLFMDTPFAYFTDANRPALYFAEILILMTAIAVVGFFSNEIMIKISKKSQTTKAEI